MLKEVCSILENITLVPFEEEVLQFTFL